MESEAASGIYSGLMPEPYPFLFKVCDTVDEDCTVELDYLPDGVDCDTSDKVLEGAHCAISTSSIEKAIEMVRADERAHLWSRADDPEVVEAVDSICIVHGMSRTESEGLIETVLAALIGPRPQGEEEE